MHPTAFCVLSHTTAYQDQSHFLGVVLIQHGSTVQQLDEPPIGFIDDQDACHSGCIPKIEQYSSRPGLTQALEWSWDHVADYGLFVVFVAHTDTELNNLVVLAVLKPDN
jgi:hypothetical protein